MDATSSPAWISVADAAILLKVRPATIIRQIEKGTLPARTPEGMPFTYDGKPNYEIRLDALPQRLQYQYPAQQALITTALNSGISGINAFTTIIGRCITLARVQYYNSTGHSIPDKTKCIRTEVPGGAAYPGAKLILTLPITPEPIHISEQMVSDMQSEYKSHFPKMVTRTQTIHIEEKSPSKSAN